MLFSGLQINIKILGGIGVLHIHRHIELHAAHQIHYLDEGVQIHQRVAVRHKAKSIFDLLHKLVHAVFAAAGIAAGGIYLWHAVIGVGHIGVPGDAEKSGAVICTVHA